jgi:CRP-like cAMP-binding protein
MSETVYLAKKNEISECAFMLQVGEVIFEPVEGETFRFKGSNMIVGASEIVLEKDDKKPHKRKLSILKGDYCKINKIDKRNLLPRITQYNIGFNIAKAIASNIVNLHSVVNKLNNKLGTAEKLARDYCKVFASSIFNIETKIEENSGAYLSSLVEKYKDTVTFAYGESLIDQSSATKFKTEDEALNKFKRQYSPGDVIVREREEANEMYILADGKVGVFIHDKQIDTIKEKGQIIGEMGFILNESRTATLIADEDTSLIVVDTSHIRNFFESNKEIFLQMVLTLAKRETYLCSLVNELSELISQVQPDMELEMKQVETYKEDLLNFYADLKNIVHERRHAWLSDILENLISELERLNIKPG